MKEKEREESNQKVFLESTKGEQKFSIRHCVRAKEVNVEKFVSACVTRKASNSLLFFDTTGQTTVFFWAYNIIVKEEEEE